MTIPVVTDHAVVRFLQRHCGFEQETVAEFWHAGVDVDEVRTIIAQIAQSGVDSGAEGLTWRGLRLMLRGAVVVTVITREQFYTMPRRLVLREAAARREHLQRVSA